ncbi:MAG TPA: TIGR01212 family radical SAM protein [Bacteroidales bacterium]|nr:TIGR01212 family radical SAM protein [Bacteroidales bacterium]
MKKTGSDLIFEWGHTRRFNSYTEYIRRVFGSRVQKLSVHAGFTCPNRDGKVGFGGCIFCNNDAFSPSYCVPNKSITQQLIEGIEFHRKRYRRSQGYVAYFQAFSNTYAPVEKLKKLFSEALAVDEIKGLVVGTRPDCIDYETIDYLAELSEHYFISIEFGIESCSDETLKAINRGHTFQQAVDALNLCSARNLHTGAHFILGLPGEDTKTIMQHAPIISQLPLNTIKLHQLQILKHTPLEMQFQVDPEKFSLFTLDSYIEMVVGFTERLNPAIVIERFTAEVPPRFLVAPNWGLLRTDQILSLIESEFEKRDSWQGKFYAR